MHFLKTEDFEIYDEKNFLTFRIRPKNRSIREVYFVDPSCPACKAFIENPTIVKVDIYGSPLLTEAFSVEMVPTKVRFN